MRCPRTIPVCVAVSAAWSAASAQPVALESLLTVRDARSDRASSAAAEHWSNYDNRYVQPGDTHILADITGSGVIRHIWLTFADTAPGWLSSKGSADPSEIVLRMYWDGADEPAVEAPVGDFFAAGFGQRAEVDSIPVQVEAGDAYNCFWPMPFRESARIAITNESPRPLAALYYNIDYTLESVPEAAPYFCAQYRQEFPTSLDGDYLIADIRGRGHYVGTVMSVRSRSPMWFGEGDEKIFVDGEAAPSIWGTGTEDYFLGAWGFDKCRFPCYGVTMMNAPPDQIGFRATMYRWHIFDPIRFNDSLRFTIEHAGWMSADETTTGEVAGFVTREDDFATVAFWYQVGQPRRFTAIPTADERRLPLIDTLFEGQDLLATAEAEDGSVHLQAGGPWTGDGQLFFDGQGGSAAFSFTITVEEVRKTHLIIPVTHSYDFGVYQIWLDGEKLGHPIDFYSPTVEVREHAFERSLPPGEHTFRFECTGRNPASTGYKLGVDSIRLRHRYGPVRKPLHERD